jgi:hypothetical protein
MNLILPLCVRGAQEALFLMVFLAMGLGAAFGEEPWMVYQPPGPESFSVSTPVKLQKREGQDEWRATDGAGRLYSVGLGYYTLPARITNSRAFMNMMINRLAADMKSRVAYSVFFKYQYAPACEFKLVDLQGHQVAAGRYFLVHQWFYFLDYTTSDKAFDVKAMKKFFESFRMVNPGLKDLQPLTD